MPSAAPTVSTAPSSPTARPARARRSRWSGREPPRSRCGARASSRSRLKIARLRQRGAPLLAGSACVSSALEVYNEQCNDLSRARARQSQVVRETAGSACTFPGLSERDAEQQRRELEDLLRAAERQRHVGATASNDRSSRLAPALHAHCRQLGARAVRGSGRDDAEEDDEQPSGGAADVLSVHAAARRPRRSRAAADPSARVASRSRARASTRAY